MTDYGEGESIDRVQVVHPKGTFTLEADGRKTLVGEDPGGAQGSDIDAVRLEGFSARLPKKLLSLELVGHGSVTVNVLSVSAEGYQVKHNPDGTFTEKSIPAGAPLALGRNADLKFRAEGGVLHILDLANIEDEGENRRKILTVDWEPSK
jgi:hypothetical protein